ncbi:Cytochrome P450 [Macleaya cordata]|uniref:Cytochrome P450 n=1 Tax=Macleaya cordata TaxID=56857 RepID=A0A200RCY1_MACCD|nr:Cytochrome P450 [Macleaya cordata]
MGLSDLFLLLQQLVEQKQDPLRLHPFSLTLLIIVFSSGIFLLLRRLQGAVRSREKLNPPPSPPRFPIIGNIHQLGPQIHRVFRDLSQKYGPLMLLRLGQKPIVVVSSAEMAAEILKTHDLVFADRLGSIAAKVIFYGCNDIALSPYGEYWRQVRRICVLELLSIKRVQSFRFVREEEVAKVIDKISSSSSVEETINLSELLFSLSNKIISRCSLGDNYKKEYTNRFAELLKEADCLMRGFSFGDFFPLLGWIDVLNGFTAKLRRTSQELDTFFDQVIDDHLLSKSHVDDDEDQDDKKNFIDLLLLHAEKDNLSLTRDNIKGIIMDMFVGGSDTSATIIEWTMAELIKNPKLMKKAQEEIRRVVGKKSKVEEQDIYQMDYLKYVIKESLRLHAPLPTLVARKSTASAKIGGYDVPANTGVFINAWAIQRDSKSWDNPEEFRPERFINNSIDFKGQDFQFIPFGSGRRGCPGMSFGLAVVEFVLANLLYGFNWELPGGANSEELDMTEGFGITINRKIPLHVVPKLFHSASS